MWKGLTEAFLRCCPRISFEWLRKPRLPSRSIGILCTVISHTWNRDVNSSTAIFYSVLMNYGGVFRCPAETAERHAAVDTLWARHYLLLPLCPNKQFEITSSSNWTLHGLCVAYNIEPCYVRKQLQFVMCFAEWIKGLFSHHVIVSAHNDVVNMLYFEPEIISSVSVIVTYLGAFASLWNAH